MSIHPLPPEQINEATALIMSVFPRDTQHTQQTLQAYATGSEHLHWKERSLASLDFWITTDSQKIVGIIGLYEKNNQHDTCWLSWFYVHHANRGKGIGTMLLTYAIIEAKKRGKAYLRLYTSTAPEEAQAQELYEKFGFQEIRREVEPETQYQRIYKELRLAESA